MKIETVRLHARGIATEEGRWSAFLLFPHFTEEAEGQERLNAFYGQLFETVKQTAARLSCTVIGDTVVACREDTFYSLVLDLLFYRGRDLIACQRLADTRLWSGIVLPPPKEVRRRIPKHGGWYFDGKRYVLFQNTFTPEQGSGVRRSAYRRFFLEVCYPS
jgi:hypothetical protein